MNGTNKNFEDDKKRNCLKCCYNNVFSRYSLLALSILQIFDGTAHFPSPSSSRAPTSARFAPPKWISFRLNKRNSIVSFYARQK